MIPAELHEALDLAALNPYPGLRPFRTEESDRFFGRGQQIAELGALLERHSFLAVVGDSGCGKSSLVLAGLLAALGKGAGARGWRPVVMRPGLQPIATLAARLAPALGDTDFPRDVYEGSLHGHLRLGDLGLAEAVRMARLPEGARILVVVDQFEEVFRLAERDVEEARAFVKLILIAALDPDSPLSVVITLRANEIGRCALFRDLPEAVCRGQFLVPRLTLAQRREAIVGPPGMRDRAIAPRLVQRVLNDVRDDYDDLLVMQHALMRTWGRWACEGAEGPIDLEHYQAIGTTRGALSAHAEEALEGLAELVPVVEQVFRVIARRTPEGHVERRPLPLARLQKVVGEDPAKIERVVRHFQAPDVGFFIPPPGELSGASSVDVVHEALFRQCMLVRGWVMAEDEKRGMLLRLVDAAERRRAGKGSLWQGEDLEEALEWRQAERPTEAWASLYVAEGTPGWAQADAFLEESRAAEGRARNRRWRVRLALGLLGVILVAGAFVLLPLRRQARGNELATRARGEARSSTALAARLALEATRHGAGGQVRELFRQSLAALEVAHIEGAVDLPAPLRDARLGRGGAQLVVASGDAVTILDARTLVKPGKTVSTGPVQRAWLVDGDGKLLTQAEDGSVQMRDLGSLAGGAKPWTLGCANKGAQVFSVAVTQDSKRIALGCLDGTVRMFDAVRPDAPPVEYGRASRGDTVTALGFSEDGTYLAAGDAGGVIRIWKVGLATEPWIGPPEGQESSWPLRHEVGNAVRAVVFHPRHLEYLVSSGDDKQVAVWRVDLERRRLARKDDGTLARWPVPHERLVPVVRFAPREDAPNQFVTVSDKRVFVWESEGSPMNNLRGHDDWVNDIDASSDGEALVTASSDGTARVWSTRGGPPLATLRHRAEVERAIFGREPGQLVTASEDGAVRLWRYALPRVVDAVPGWTFSAAIDPQDPSGARLAVGTERGVRVLLLAGGKRTLAATLPLPRGMEQVGFLSWGPEGRLLGCATTERLQSPRPVLWDVAGRHEVTPPWLERWYGARFAPDGHELVTWGPEGSAVWGLDALAGGSDGARSPSPRLQVGSGVHILAAVSGDGRWIATYGVDEKLQLWDRSKHPATFRVLEGHEGSLRSIVFSPDSRALLAAGSDGTARVWEVEREAKVHILRTPSGRALMSAAFDPQGRRVVAGATDGTVHVWKVEGEEVLAMLRRHGEAVNDVHFSSDGAEILSASDDGTVKLGRCETCSRTDEELEEKLDAYAVLDDDGKSRLKEILRGSRGEDRKDVSRRGTTP